MITTHTRDTCQKVKVTHRSLGSKLRMERDVYVRMEAIALPPVLTRSVNMDVDLVVNVLR